MCIIKIGPDDRISVNKLLRGYRLREIVKIWCTEYYGYEPRLTFTSENRHHTRLTTNIIFLSEEDALMFRLKYDIYS
jgi:hypothetical protein